MVPPLVMADNPANVADVERVFVPITTKEDARTSWRAYINPELLQPTIIAFSVTYIIYAIGALYNLTPNLPAETQFTYYVASLGLISSLLFYGRFATSSLSYVSFMELAHIASSSVVIAVFIMYWFIAPNFSKYSLVTHNSNSDRTPYTNLYLDPDEEQDILYQVPAQKPTLDLSKCIDTRKCTHPVHLVLQSAYMICIVLSLVFSIIRRG